MKNNVTQLRVKFCLCNLQIRIFNWIGPTFWHFNITSIDFTFIIIDFYMQRQSLVKP